MNRLLSVVGVFLAVPCADVAHAEVLAGLFNTGVDAQGVALAAGASDPHYQTITGAPTILATPSSWVTPPENARWISAIAGRTDVSITFELEVFIPPDADLTTVVITGRVAADPRFDILVPGGLTVRESGTPAHRELLPFEIDNAEFLDTNRGKGLVHGINKISFRAQGVGGGARGAFLVTDLEGRYVGTPVEFIRGDCNENGEVDMSDAVCKLSFQFLGRQIPCVGTADVDDNGSIEVTDAIGLLAHLFLGAIRPFPPFPACGVDATHDGLICASHAACERDQ